MYCYQCGKEVEDSKFCPYCGAVLDGSSTLQPPISHVRNDDEASIGFALLSFFIPVVGLVLYLVWNKEYPKKAKSCLKGFIANIVTYVIFFCCAISFFIGMASSYDNNYKNNYKYDYDDSYYDDSYYDDSYYEDIFNSVIQQETSEQ